MVLGGGKTPLVTFALLAALALSLTPAGHGTVTAGKGCMPVSVATSVGTFTYAVRLEAGAVGCGAERAAVRDVADWPLDGDGTGGGRRGLGIRQGTGAWGGVLPP